jgi:hypothetical protein
MPGTLLVTAQSPSETRIFVRPDHVADLVQGPRCC